MLAAFSGKIPACSVQIPFFSDSGTSACNSALPTPRRRAALATYTDTSATPAYTRRLETGLSAAHPSTRVAPRGIAIPSTASSPGSRAISRNDCDGCGPTFPTLESPSRTWHFRLRCLGRRFREPLATGPGAWAESGNA
jgi:hypothetical protein